MTINSTSSQKSPWSQKQAGIGTVTLLVFGVIAFVIGYAAYNIAPFYYDYYELENQFQTIIQIASTEDDGEIRRRLMTHIKQMGIPIEKPEDLKIERDAGKMKIDLKYREVFYIPKEHIPGGTKDIDVWVFPFHAHGEGRY